MPHLRGLNIDIFSEMNGLLNEITLPSLESLTSSCHENAALIPVPGLRLAFPSIIVGLREDKAGPWGWERSPLTASEHWCFHFLDLI